MDLAPGMKILNTPALRFVLSGTGFEKDRSALDISNRIMGSCLPNMILSRAASKGQEKLL